MRLLHLGSRFMRPLQTQSKVTVAQGRTHRPHLLHPQTEGIGLRETQTQNGTQKDGSLRPGWDLNKTTLFQVSSIKLRAFPFKC